MAYAVVDDRAVMVKALDASTAGHAMDSRRGPDGSAKEAEIIQVPIVFQSLIQMYIELLQVNAFGVAGVSAHHHKIHQY